MRKLVALEISNGVPYFLDVEKKVLYYRENDTKGTVKYVISFVVLYLALKFAGVFFEDLVKTFAFGGIFSALVVFLCFSTKEIGRKNLVRCSLCHLEWINRLPGIKRHFFLQCICFATAIAALIWGVKSFISTRSYNGLLLLNYGIIAAYALLLDRFYDKPKIIQMIKQGEL